MVTPPVKHMESQMCVGKITTGQRGTIHEAVVFSVTTTHCISSSPQSAESLCLVWHQVFGQAFTDVELDLTGDHVLVSEQLQLPYPTPLHHLENNLLWKLAEPESKHSSGVLGNVCSFPVCLLSGRGV